jgi:hypothetical protein
LQALLEQQKKFSFFEGDPAQNATKYVQDIWEKMPNVFGGRGVTRPHKLSAVACSLALAAETLNRRGDRNT